MLVMSIESRHLSIAVERPAAVVYEFAANPQNLPLWAAGLASSTVERVEGRWMVDSPMGKVTVDFADRNDLGVLDHVVTLPSGQSVYNPLRVIPAGEDCEVVFTLRRQPEMTEEQFEEDAAAVRADLAALKLVVEAG